MQVSRDTALNAFKIFCSKQNKKWFTSPKKLYRLDITFSDSIHKNVTHVFYHENLKDVTLYQDIVFANDYVGDILVHYHIKFRTLTEIEAILLSGGIDKVGY